MKRIVTALIFVTLVAAASWAHDNMTPAEEKLVSALIEALGGGIIVPFKSNHCPPDYWTEYEPATGHFLRGIESGEEVGKSYGDASHVHAGWTSTGHGRIDTDDGDIPMSPEGHQHEYTTDKANNIPPYVSVVFCVLK